MGGKKKKAADINRAQSNPIVITRPFQRLKMSRTFWFDRGEVLRRKEEKTRGR